MTNDDPTDPFLSVIQVVYKTWAADADTFAQLYTDDATVVQPGKEEQRRHPDHHGRRIRRPS